MKRNKITLRFVLLLLFFSLFFVFVPEKAFAKSEIKEIVKISDKVLPDFSFSNSTEAEIKVFTILSAAKKKVEVDYFSLTPDEKQYNQYDLKEYEKTSKKLFGKIIPHNLKDKTEGGMELYFDKRTKTIFEEVPYDPGDVAIHRNRREFKKIGKNRYVVHNYDSSFYPLSLDKRPTKKMSVFIKKVKKGYEISDLKLEDIPIDTVKIGTKEVEKQIREIKKWFKNPTKNVEKKSFRYDGSIYITLTKNENILFIYEDNGDVERRYYYKDGVPIRVMESKGKKKVFSYDLSFQKKGEILINGKKFQADDEVLRYFSDADFTYDVIDRSGKR